MADTVELVYSEVGQGTPVVLLHGFPLTNAIWHAQQESLGEHFRVLTPDLRGHGRSPAPPGIYDMDLMARDVLAWLDARQVKKAVIMGHSMGGYVALATWKRQPERFLALGLIASHAGADTEEGRQGRYKLVDKVAAEGSQAAAAALLPKLFAPGSSAEVPTFDQVRQMILQTPVAGIIGSLQGMAVRPDSTSILANVRVPTLIVAGSRDQIIPLEKAKSLAATLPMATLALVDNAGHMPMLEQPQATTTAIRQFLQAAALDARDG
jgi:pimeloyl-ACP methyl ester carboxylesterase